ncbi:MAG: aminoacyl-tRNA hydrolase [Sphingobacteriia bacterium]|nr:aminoacyl-tRNA hydrolase [Sphingobacteriia bacterium]
MKLICGLGNPGPEYTLTRHNIGFLFIDYFTEYLNQKANSSISFKHKWQGEIATTNYKGNELVLLKPITFMNLSGKSVQQVASFYKIKVEDILVIHDDIDLDFAKIKVKQGGSSGGHNGLKSIDSLVGNNYFRLRIGVGKKGNASSHVLGKFKEAELDELEGLFLNIANNFQTLLNKDLNNFTTKIALEK